MAKCLLCNSSKQNEVSYGQLLQKREIVVHEFCLYLSSGLVQNGDEGDGLFGFLPEDIIKESNRVRKLYCCFCHQLYANIGCCRTKCQRTFHMICGLQNGVKNHFTGTFRSYCNQHIGKSMRSKPSVDETCCICFDQLLKAKGKNHSVDLIRAPCCLNGWFHKNCLQGFARSAGYFFKCPLCNDTNKFRERVPYLGIFIRNSDASWELEPNAFAELMQRPNKCEAETCQNRKGRQYVDSERDPLVYCEICGAKGSHERCLPKGMQNFICSECIQFPTVRPSTSEADSGRESLQTGEDEDVDVCDISDSDDDIVMTSRRRKNLNRVLDTTYEDAEKDHIQNSSNIKFTGKNREIKNENFEEEDMYLKSKLKNQSSLRYSKDNGKLSLELACHEDNDENQPSSFQNRNRKRKTDCCSPINISIVDSDLDSDIDPLDCLDKIFKKKRKNEDLNRTIERDVNAISTKTVFDSPALTYTNVSQTHQVPCDVNLKSKQEHIPKNIVQSDDSTTKENGCEILEPDTKNTPLDISCIANRTRRRRTINSKTITNKTDGHQVDENNKQRGATFLSSTNEKTEEVVSPLDVSCIAKRTRRRKTVYYPEKVLTTIGEEILSENSDYYQTPKNDKNSIPDRLNDPRNSRDDGFSSDSQSTFSTIYSISEKSVRHVRKQHLRLISISSDEELDENDAMKIR